MLLLQSLLHSFEHWSLQKNQIPTLIETAFDVVEYIAGMKCFIIHFSHATPYFPGWVHTHIFIQNHFLINFVGAVDCTQGLISANMHSDSELALATLSK